MRSKTLTTALLLAAGAHAMTADAQHLAAGAQRTMFRAPTELSGQQPASVDNSKSKYFPPVINQQGGSCAQAAGIAYMMTYEMNRLLDRDATASAGHRLSYQFAWNLLNEGEDQGGFVSQGLELARHYGIMTEADFGLLFSFKWANGYSKYLNAMHYRAEEIYMYEDSVPLMKRYLYDKGDGSAAGGVLTFSGQSTGWTIDSRYDGPSQTGYHSLLTSLATDGSHAMTIVGYDDLVSYVDDNGVGHKGAFIVVNSWGIEWQDQGRFYLPYDFFRDPTVKSFELSNTVEGVKVAYYEPKVALKATIDYTSRDDLYLRTGVTDDPTQQRPRQMRVCPIFNNQGGDLPMQGAYRPSELELAVDMTPQMETGKDYCLCALDIVRGFRGKKKGEGRLVALALVDYRGGEPVEYVCRDSLPRTLQDGNNFFTIPLKPRFTVAASPYRYTDGAGNPANATYLLRTAEGQHAKIKFSNLDQQGQTISIKYEVRE